LHGILLLLHVLAATIWTGGHIVLSLVILPKALKAGSPDVLLSFESVFEKLGMPALFIQITTGLALAYHLVPDVAQWFVLSNPLSIGIMLKLSLLALTFCLALNARFRVIPTLSASTLNVMALHIAAVTFLSIIFVVVGVSFRAGWLY